MLLILLLSQFFGASISYNYYDYNDWRRYDMSVEITNKRYYSLPFDVNEYCYADINENLLRAFFLCENIDLYSSANSNSMYQIDEQITYTDIRIQNSDLATLSSNISKAFPKTQYLTINNCSITAISDDFFAGFTGSLVEIAITDNRFDTLTKEYFSNFPVSLKILDLSGNGLQNILKDTSFSNGNKLQELYLRNNKITFFPMKLLKSLLELQIIDLSDNSIDNIANDAFMSNKNLKEIILRKNSIKLFGEGILENHKQLNLLDVSMNPLKVFNFTSANMINASYTSLKSCIVKNVSVVYASDCKISSVWIEDTRILKELHLSDNFLNSIENMTKAENLEYLDLSLNSITAHNNTILDFQTMLKLKVLNLSECNLSNNLNYYTFQHLSNLKSLDLSNNHLRNLTGSIFYPLRNIEKLYLQGNQLERIDYRDCDVLKPSLLEINLSPNNWSCDYLKTMIEFLTTRNVRVLNVDGNKCKPTNFFSQMMTTTTEEPFDTISQDNEHSLTPTTETSNLFERRFIELTKKNFTLNSLGRPNNDSVTAFFYLNASTINFTINNSVKEIDIKKNAK